MLEQHLFALGPKREDLPLRIEKTDEWAVDLIRRGLFTNQCLRYSSQQFMNFFLLTRHLFARFNYDYIITRYRND